jgi:hypothetical protein
MKASVQPLYRRHPFGGVCLKPGARVSLADAAPDTIGTMYRYVFGEEPNESVNYMRGELMRCNVIAVQADKNGWEEVVKLTLAEALAAAFQGTVKESESCGNTYHEISCSATPATLKTTGKLIREVVKTAGYVSQGKDLFPAYLGGTNVPEFYVEKIINKNFSILAVIILGGTSVKPTLTIEYS